MNSEDLLKSSPPSDQDNNRMDTMTMMMMMQLPEFSGAYSNDIASDDSTLPELSPAATRTDTDIHGTTLHFLDNSPVISSSSFTSLQSATISFTSPTALLQERDPAACGRAPSEKGMSMAAMREMIFRIAVMQPIHVDPESVKPPKRRNVKISKDPQSVAARHRRERISERIRILQRLVPGGTKMDTASMLDEAIHYVKFLKTQVQSLERAAAGKPAGPGMGFPVAMSTSSYSYHPLPSTPYHFPTHHNVQHVGHDASHIN